MRLIRTSVLVIGFTSTAMSAAFATDFYLKPIKPGSISAPALTTMSVPGVSTSGTTVGQTGTTSTTTSTSVSRTVSSKATSATGPANTYASLTALINAKVVKGGDRIFLMDGYHGPLQFRKQNYASPVLVSPLPGATAQVDSILIDSTSNLVFQNLNVWPTSTTAGKAPLVRSYGAVSNLSFINLDVRALPDATNYRTWSKTTWIANKRAGFLVDGNAITIQGSRVTGTQNGIIAMGDNALIENNTIDGFSADAMRALGDNSIVRGNFVENCVSIDATHHDGFQSYSVGSSGKPGSGVQKNLLIENNRFFESVGKPNSFPCLMQGIGMFDGMYDGLTIQNNEIAVSAYHGIAVAGALNATIRQNTVVAASGKPGKFPWIKISSHKNGTASKNVMIANNLVTSIAMTADTKNNIQLSNNAIAGAATNEFTNFTILDMSLKATSKGVDAGSPKLNSPTDIMGVKRWKGKAPDAGAVESR